MDKMEYLEKLIDELKTTIKEEGTCRIEVEKQLVAIEQSLKSFHKRVDKAEETIDIIREVVTSIKIISEKVEKTVTLLESHDSRLDTLERAPGDFFKANAKVIFASFITGMMGAGITLLFKKIGG